MASLAHKTAALTSQRSACLDSSSASLDLSGRIASSRMKTIRIVTWDETTAGQSSLSRQAQGEPDLWVVLNPCSPTRMIPEAELMNVSS